jgi:hypothetical protein
MNSFLNIRGQLSRTTGAQTGTVVSADGDLLRVQSVAGTKTVRGTAPIGAEVLVRDGAVEGRVSPAESLSIYHV